MGRRTRECYLCGETYNYCPTCSQDKVKPTWMVEFHNENCKTIFDICTRFNMKLLTKDEAKEALSKCDLSNKANFKDYAQKDIANIFAEDKKAAVEKTAKAPKAAKTPVVEKTETVHEVVNKTEEK